MKHVWQTLWSRRALLRRTAAAVLLLLGGRILWRVYFPAKLGTQERDKLAVVLDTLIPDGEFPGARQTGILEPLLAQCDSTRQTRRALSEGLELLDRHAQRLGHSSFELLTAPQREAVLLECAAAAPGSLPWFFFRTIREGAMRLHYAHPLAWRAIGLSGPPQPRGYRDYTQKAHV